MAVKKAAPIEATACGVTVTIDPNALNDFETFELIAKLNEGDMFVFPQLFRRVIGAGADVVLKDLADKKTGRVTLDVASEFLKEVLEQLDPNS